MWLKVQQVFPSGHRLSPGRRFPLRAASGASPAPGLDYHLAHTLIPAWPRFPGQPRSFPPQEGLFLASFAVTVSALQPPRARSGGPLFSGIHRYHSRQATLHAASTTCRFTPQAIVRLFAFPRTWVSAEPGSTPACPCGSPQLLNSQYQPPTGRRQPAPGTSSVCPRRIFRPAFKKGLPD